MYISSRMKSQKRGAAKILAETPTKVAKKIDEMVESDSETDSKEGSPDAEDVIMGDKTADTGKVKKKGRAKTKKKAGFNVEERHSKLIELQVQIEGWELPIPSVIGGIATALAYIDKSDPNIRLRLEKLKGGGMIVPTDRGIPDNWVALAKYVRMINGTAPAMMKKAATQGDTAEITIRISSMVELTDKELVQAGIGICHQSDGSVSLGVKDFQVQESTLVLAVANAVLMPRGRWNDRDVSEGLKAGHVKDLQDWGKTPGEIAVLVKNTDYSCSTKIDYPLNSFHLGKQEAKVLKASPSTKMMILVAVSKESEPAFLRARVQIGIALRKILGRRTRLVRMLTNSSGAAETDTMLGNVISNFRIHHALASVTMSGYPMVDKFHELFKLRLVDPNTGLPSELFNELSLCMIVLNEEISRDTASGRKRFLAYAALP